MDLQKKRDYSFDAVRGFCMFLIPLQHFLAADKPFVYGSVGGYLYLVIDLFVMQVFFFLSGYFSKNAARGRQIAAGSLLWPVIVMWLACGLVRVAGFAIPIRLYRPPYAMWFLLCLFYYRMFQTAYLKIPHLAGVVFVLGLLIGLVPFIGRDFALARAINWMPYFLLGYYCQPAHISRLRSLKGWQTAGLLAVLLGGIWLFLRYAAFDAYKAVQMADSYAGMHVTVWQGIALHIVVFFTGIAFLVVLLNLFKGRQDRPGLWSWIGQHTMPVYIFHLPVKYLLYRFGIGFGVLQFSAGSLPACMYVAALAFVVTVVLATPPFNWLYDLLFVRSLAALKWCAGHMLVPAGAVVQKVFDRGLKLLRLT